MIESIVRRVPLSRAGWALVALAGLALVPVRLVAKETVVELTRPSDEETHCLDIGKDVETAYVITNGKSHAMCGDVADVREAEAARGGGPDIVWFRIGDQRYVIRDPEAVAQARRYFGSITETAQMQSELAMEQARTGMEQARGGVEQANAGMEQAERARQELEETMRKAELDAARQHDRVQDTQRNREELKKELQAAQAGHEKAAADMERNRERLAEEMEVASQRMNALGDHQRKLGERMDRELQKTHLALSEFLEKAIKDGEARREY